MKNIKTKILAAVAIGIAALLTLQAGVYSGQTTIPTAGTRVRVVAVSTPAIGITIQAASTNTNNVYVGGSSVSSSSGVALIPGASFAVLPASNTPAYNLTDFWLDTDTNGNVVKWTYTK